MVGVDPHSLTLHELTQMAEARCTVDWDHTCELIAIAFNTHKSEKQRAIEGHKLNPYRKRRAKSASEKPKLKASIKDLKRVFVDQRRR